MNLVADELADVLLVEDDPGDALLIQESFGPAESSNRRCHVASCSDQVRPGVGPTICGANRLTVPGTHSF